MEPLHFKLLQLDLFDDDGNYRRLQLFKKLKTSKSKKNATKQTKMETSPSHDGDSGRCI